MESDYEYQALLNNIVVAGTRIIEDKTVDIEEKMCYHKKVYDAKFSVGAVGYFKFGAVDFSPEKLLKMPNKCCIFQIKCYYVY